MIKIESRQKHSLVLEKKKKSSRQKKGAFYKVEKKKKKKTKHQHLFIYITGADNLGPKSVAGFFCKL